MDFVRGFEPVSGSPETSWWFLFSGSRLLIKLNGEEIPLPFSTDLSELDLSPVLKHHLGKLNDAPCLSAQIPDDAAAPEGMAFRGVRELFGVLDDDMVGLAGLANQIVSWDQSHQFCGGCGEKMAYKKDERAKVCPSCELVNYPRLSPAIIVAVTKGDKILLGTSARFRGGFYSVLAGFVEPGESLEECVKREVKEEAGVEVKNIRYFGSQPWPFPDSLMLGFTADYASGEILTDKTEILDAHWFTADSLPRIPGKISIARRLIDWFVAQQITAGRREWRGAVIPWL